MALIFTWDATFEALPPGTEDLSLGAGRIVDLKKAISERMKISGSWAGNSDDGKTIALQCLIQGSDPTVLATDAALYFKTRGGVEYPYWREESSGAVREVVGLDTVQVLTNKTLIVPVITNFVNAQHDHADIAGGGNTLVSPTITGVMDIPTGTAGAPSLAFTGDLNTGIYSPGENVLRVVTAGVSRLSVTSSGIDLPAGGGIRSNATGTAEFLATKVIKINSWNMDTAPSVSVAHGLSWTKIRHVSAVIRKDDDSSRTTLLGTTAGTEQKGSLNWDSGNIVLSRSDLGLFDSSVYDVMGSDGNRGWITIIYAI